MMKHLTLALGLLTLTAVSACGGDGDAHDDHDHSHGEAPIELTASVDGSSLTLNLDAPVTAYGAAADEASAAMIDAEMANKLNVEGVNTAEALASYFVLPEAAGCVLNDIGRGLRTGPNTYVSMSLGYECAAVDKLNEVQVTLTELDGFGHIDAIALRGDGQRKQHLEGKNAVLRLD